MRLSRYAWSVIGLPLLLGAELPALAMELDWSGQFWAEYNYVHNYEMDSSSQALSVDPVRDGAGGYYAPSGGSRGATFENLFLRLRPKVIVNDNVYIKSEIWLSDPIYGIYGSNLPYTPDQRQYYSSQSRGSLIRAQRVWGELLSDFGTFQVGRVPLGWGLGLVWNAGDRLWDRYMSTGDGVRWIAQFGAFSIIPSFIVNSTGNTIGGSYTAVNNGKFLGFGPGSSGDGGVTDYSLILKYENDEEQLEVGVNLLKRLAGSGQDPAGGVLTPGTANSPATAVVNTLTYDIYATKKFDRLSLALEMPISGGQIGAANYSAFGLGLEVTYTASEITEFQLKGGYASGQSASTVAPLTDYAAFYFNPNYHIAMIMFNYQLANFSGRQTLNSPAPEGALRSPYDNPITNAQYVSVGAQLKPWEKWTLRPLLAYARAPQVAQPQSYFLNSWNKSTNFNLTDQTQGSSLGFEFDLGVSFQWDDALVVSWDNGIFFPGNYYAFSNSPIQNRTDPVIATSLRVGVNF